jgi:hypothetical protein
MCYILYAALNETHQLLICADDVSLLGEKVNTRKRSTEDLLDVEMRKMGPCSTYEETINIYKILVE